MHARETGRRSGNPTAIDPENLVHRIHHDARDAVVHTEYHDPRMLRQFSRRKSKPDSQINNRNDVTPKIDQSPKVAGYLWYLGHLSDQDYFLDVVDGYAIFLIAQSKCYNLQNVGGRGEVA